MNPGPFARSIGGLCAAEEPAIVAACITNARLIHPASRFSDSSTSLSAFGPASDNLLRKTTRHDCPILTIVQIWPK